MKHSVFFLVFFLQACVLVAQNGAFSKPKIYAVVVGVSSYSDSNIPNLKFAGKDAQAFYDFLRSPNAGSVPVDDMALLINTKATRSNIIRELVDKLTRATKEDLVIFYFSGHGKSGEFENAGYLLGYDTEADNEPATAISMNEIKSKIDRSAAKMKISYIDACHAGLFKSNGAKGEANDNAEIIKAYLEGLTNSGDGNAAFLASSARQQSLEDETLGHGVFTYYLIKGLQGEADKEQAEGTGYNNGIVTISEMATYLINKIQKKTKYKQKPSLEGSYDDEFPLSVLRTGIKLSSEIKKRPEKKTATTEKKILTDLPADEKLPVNVLYDGHYCYGQYQFINGLKTPVTLYYLRGLSQNGEQYPNLKLPAGGSATTARLFVETSNYLNALSDCADKFIEYTFYFKTGDKGAEKYGMLTATVEAGKKKFFLLTEETLYLTTTKPE
ncbi:MAG TPA: caspase family protein [Flavisolibacter sp.]|nr:caspase family protein [Flavisolibacter sp.]